MKERKSERNERERKNTINKCILNHNEKRVKEKEKEKTNPKCK